MGRLFYGSFNGSFNGSGCCSTEGGTRRVQLVRKEGRDVSS